MKHTPTSPLYGIFLQGWLLIFGAFCFVVVVLPVACGWFFFCSDRPAAIARASLHIPTNTLNNPNWSQNPGLNNLSGRPSNAPAGAVPRAPVPMYPPVGQIAVTPARETVRTKPTKVTRPKPAPAWQPPGTKGSSSSDADGMFNADGTFK